MHKLVLIRHGESTWNLENRFTGWTDVELTPTGISQAMAAGKLLKAEGYDFDIAYTSVLKRAIHTLNYCLEEMDRIWLPVVKDWRLNERHYGGLQGLNKADMAKQYGDEQVLIWRRSYDTPPPALEPQDPRGQRSDLRYARLAPEQVPLTECLKDTVARVLPCWNERLAPAIRSGQRVVIAAHGNSIRALVKYLDGISDADIVLVDAPSAPTGGGRRLLKVGAGTEVETAALTAAFDAGDIDGVHFILLEPAAELPAAIAAIGTLLRNRPGTPASGSGTLRERLGLALPPTASTQSKPTHVPEYVA